MSFRKREIPKITLEYSICVVEAGTLCENRGIKGVRGEVSMLVEETRGESFHPHEKFNILIRHTKVLEIEPKKVNIWNSRKRLRLFDL